MNNTVVIRLRPDDRKPATVRVELPRRVTWPTRASVRKWELRVVAEARYTIITMDTNVTTLILDGKAFSSRLRNAMATLPALATAVAVALMHDFGEILRVRRSELAHRWLAATPPLIYSEIDTSWLQRYFEFVDAAANEMGKMPTLCDISSSKL